MWYYCRTSLRHFNVFSINIIKLILRQVTSWIQTLFLVVYSIEPGKNLLPKTSFETHTSQIYCDTAGMDGATLTLENTYLVNCLRFEAYRNVPDYRQLQKTYSYTVSVSRDKSEWLQLFDYSAFACRGRQKLTFPTLAVRYHFYSKCMQHVAA